MKFSELLRDQSLHDLQHPHQLQSELRQLKEELLHLAENNSEQFTRHDHILLHEQLPFLQQMNQDVKHAMVDVIPLLKGALLEVKDGDVENEGRRAAAGEDARVSAKLIGDALSQHTMLIQLLEIPQLMETCIRQDMYSESLDLYDHVVSLSDSPSSASRDAISDSVRKSTESDGGGGRPLLESIGLQCHALILQQMIPRLVSQLTDRLNLPLCLRLMSHMRRLWNHETWKVYLPGKARWLPELFLSLRRDHLEKLLRPEKQQPLLTVIDIVRQYCFDLSMQYQALFPSESDLPLLAMHLTSVFDQMLVEEYLRPCVAQKITTGELIYRLADRLLQCGNTLSRIGHEVRDHVIFDVVEKRLLSMLEDMLVSALDEFRMKMEHFSLENDVIDSHSTQSGDVSGGATEDNNRLLQYPPLASVTNGFLRALNELRQCAPTTARTRVVDLFERQLDELHQIVMNKTLSVDDMGPGDQQHMSLLSSGKGTAGRGNERLQWNKMIGCMKVHCIDHIRHCLQSIYGGKADGDRTMEANEGGGE